MDTTVNTERAVQNRVIGLLCRVHGYDSIGNLAEQENRPIIEGTLRKFLAAKQNCTELQCDEAVRTLRDAAICDSYAKLTDVNCAVYDTLRYPVSVSQGAGKVKRQVSLIDWDVPENNIFQVAEEVTVRRVTEDLKHRRPDVVVYVNGIAVAVIELKKATVSVAEGIRQNYRNQKDGEIVSFFATAQLLMAGSESEGVKYATIKTPEQFWVKWKEPCGSPCPKTPFTQKDYPNPLDRALLQMLEPTRLVRFIHDSVVFDGGIKKVMRPSQVFALEAAKRRIANKESGIIWHSQGSGKSLLMVWLAQYILETQKGARVIIVTDRDELDKQIKNGFVNARKKPERATSCHDLICMLGGFWHYVDRRNVTHPPCPDIICTLVHKFGIAEPGARDASADERRLSGKRTWTQYLEAVAAKLPKNFKAKGNLFVFVDECHRTQGGILNRAMKRIMGEDAMIIGFTGTPLLRVKPNELRLTSRENFGDYIHTYKFDEAVADEVVRDLRYEARDVEQALGADADFDTIFGDRTQNLTPKAKERLKDRWAKLQHLFSSKERIDRIVASIDFDMVHKPALREGWGNAMLIADSIYQAYRYWDAFQRTALKGHCAVVTSYGRKDLDLSEESGGETENEAQFKHAKSLEMFGGKTALEFEEWAKKAFVDHPGDMKLLIVVSKLITGFDAPPATYLYIDKHMEDQDLFQAICRVNRVNGDRKKFGYVIDFQNLFEQIQDAVEDYTNGAFKGFDKRDIEGLVKGRIAEGRKELDAALELCARLSEPVRLPKTIDDYFDFFCFDQRTTKPEEEPAKLEENARKREDFYAACARLVHAFAAIDTSMIDAGYTKEECAAICAKVKDYDQIRDALMKRCGDFVDLKAYDATMRQLLDQYVTARHAEKISGSEMDDLSFLDLIVTDPTGGELTTDPGAEEALGGKRGVAETIAAHVRRVINRKRESNPAEYRSFSDRINRLLDDLRQRRIDYAEFLKQVVDVAKELKDKRIVDPRIDSEGKRALYEFLGKDIDLALAVDRAVQNNKTPGYREIETRRWDVIDAIADALKGTEYDAETVYNIVKSNEEYDA